MKVANLLKNCIIFNLGPNVQDWYEGLEHEMNEDGRADLSDALRNMAIKEPTGQQWWSTGFAEFPSKELFLDLNGDMILLVQINDRNLPARVRDERVAVLVAELEENQQRKVGKKEYAQLREQAEQELLPQAFIKRSYVPVLLAPQGDGMRMYVFTSSHKRADTVVGVIGAMLENLKVTFQGSRFAVQQSIPGGLTELAKESYESEEDDDFEFEAGSYAKLIAADAGSKKTVTVKDKDIYSQEVRDLMTAGDYRVQELDINVLQEFDIRSSFVLTSKFGIKKLALGDVLAPQVKDAGTDFYAYALLIAKELHVILENLLPMFGGELIYDFPESGMANVPSFTEEAKAKSALAPEPDLGDSDDDDEL